MRSTRRQKRNAYRLGDQAIAACGGDAREAVRALLIANEFLEREMEERVSRGYVRGVKHGRFNTYSG